MADIERSAQAVWQGDLRSGKGSITTPSGVLQEDAYTFATRFENAPGTNPEELIAAAHAACFTMAFSSALSRKNFTAEHLQTRATVMMEKQESGFAVTRIRLEVQGKVPGIDAATFQQVAAEAEKGCPISKLLRPGLQDIELIATLHT